LWLHLLIVLVFTVQVNTDKCRDDYPGPKAFSEVETRNMRDYLLQMRPAPIVSIALHSYSMLWMYPYAYTKAASPDNVQEMVRKMCSEWAEKHLNVKE